MIMFFDLDGNCKYSDWISIASSDCSGHGTCQAGRCTCDPGYSGKSDWITMEGYDCHVYIPNENFSPQWFGALLCTLISLGFVMVVLIRDLKKVKYTWSKLRKLKTFSLLSILFVDQTLILITCCCKAFKPTILLSPRIFGLFEGAIVMFALTFAALPRYAKLFLKVACKHLGENEKRDLMKKADKALTILPRFHTFFIVVLGVVALVMARSGSEFSNYFYVPYIAINIYIVTALLLMLPQLWFLKQATIGTIFQGIGKDRFGASHGSDSIIKMKRGASGDDE